MCLVPLLRASLTAGADAHTFYTLSIMCQRYMAVLPHVVSVSGHDHKLDCFDQGMVLTI